MSWRRSATQLFRLALLFSFFLHLAVLAAMEVWLVRELKQELRYPVRLYVGPPLPLRFRPVPPAAGTAGKGLRAEGGPVPMPDLVGQGPVGLPEGVGEGGSALEGMGIPGLPGVLELPAWPGGKSETYIPRQELFPAEPPDLTFMLREPLADRDIPIAFDLVELDAERRQRTVVLIDQETRRLKKAYLHLPAYRNASGYEGGREVAELFRLLNQPSSAGKRPIEGKVNYYRLGEPARWVQSEEISDSDPLHSFSGYPERQLLHASEMVEYPLLILHYIDVVSTPALVEYLVEGGFAVVNPDQLDLLHGRLQERVGKRVQSVNVDLEHPLFHCWFDLTQYRSGNSFCPELAPLPGLELDGRLIVVGVPRFVWRYPCPANQLYINVLVYGLVQPSPMGGRYWSPQ